MNVLFVIKGDEPYVSQQAQIELAAGLKKKGVHLWISGNFSEEVVLELQKLKLDYLQVYPKKSIDKAYTEEFAQLLRDKNIDLVHFVDGKSARNGLPAIKGTKVKSVIYFGSRSLHWYDPTSYFTYLSPHIDAIIGNSDFVYTHVRKQLFCKNKKKAVRIFKGYNPAWFSGVQAKDLSEFGIDKEAIVVCLVGNHRKVKGTKYFIASTHYLHTDKKVHYLLIGDQTDSPDFQAMKNKSPIKERIHLLGRRNDVVSILKSIDIYVQTSLEEGFGRAISEAMSVGKPVVMTNAGGCTELIDESSGMVVPLKDAKAIGGAISELVNDDCRRIQMGLEAKNRIERKYHIDRTINDTLKVYQDLLASS